jgi:transposase
MTACTPTISWLLGIGAQPPWQLVDQHLDTSVQPHELHLHVASERGAHYPCPTCSASCPAHDFQEKRWRHLNFFQHHCYITAAVPRVKCPEHGVRQVEVPWARQGSAFTLLFEQAISQFDLRGGRSIGLDEPTSKRGHNYVTVFIDMDRRKEPVLFVAPGRGKETLQQFAASFYVPWW